MIGYREAQDIILARTPRLPTEMRALNSAFRSFLAQDIVAPFPLPRFDHSAVDGYSITAQDLETLQHQGSASLLLSDVVRAGEQPKDGLLPGTCVKIFTGARIPNGTVAVVMIEDAIETNNTVMIVRPPSLGSNIRRTGEEFPKGSVCLTRGTCLDPAAIGLAAMLGLREISVCRSPRVSVVVTGDELVEPGQTLKDSQIYNSNTFSLVAALRELGVESVTTSRCPDDIGALADHLRAASFDADLIITSGGASVGDLDFVKSAIKRLDGEICFDKVAIKPGKPTIYASLSGIPLFGLPGNPVSILIAFFLFVRPALLKMMGSGQPLPRSLPALLGADISKRSSRTEFVRARLFDNGVQLVVNPVGRQESHMLGGLAIADCLVVFEGDAGQLPQDSLIMAMPLGR